MSIRQAIKREVIGQGTELEHQQNSVKQLEVQTARRQECVAAGSHGAEGGSGVCTAAQASGLIPWEQSAAFSRKYFAGSSSRCWKRIIEGEN